MTILNILFRPRKKTLATTGMMLCAIAPLSFGHGLENHGATIAAPSYDPVARLLHVPAVNIDNQFYEARLSATRLNPVMWELQEINLLSNQQIDSSSAALFDPATGIATVRNINVPGRGRFDFALRLQTNTAPVQLSLDSVNLDNLIAPACSLWTADRLFDGIELHDNQAILIEGETVKQVGSITELQGTCDYVVNLGDATLMPGFIESHAHLTYQSVDAETVLQHGITTVRDTGGPLTPASGGDGNLRLVSAGPIIQASNGYPLNIFGGDSGYDSIGIVSDSPEEARSVVQNLVANGVNIIKVALEPGGETGAPWSFDHGHGAPPAAPWPLMSLATVQAIVTEAHSLGKRVTAHVGDNEGASLALQAGVDEWAHMPCAAIDDALLQQAVDQGVKIISTIDTLSSCAGIYANAMKLGALLQNATSGAELLYGSEIGHDNVPWGINAQELHLMLHLTGMTPLAIFQAATAKAGENLGLAPLGTLTAGAPADMIAVSGNPFTRFKPLEYPDLVMSGGRIIVNRFAGGY